MVRRRWFAVVAVAATAATVVFLALPVVAVFASTSPGQLLASLDDESAIAALELSARTAGLALAVIVVVGTPTAYLIATRRFRGRSALVTLVELPLVLPPAVAGIALLAALGPQGLAAGPSLVLETAGVVVALVFVSAPFYVRQAQASFESLDPNLTAAARTLGASEARAFARVLVPAAAPGLMTGAALALGRALGEFGATLMFAGSLEGVTQTVPLAIYDRFATDFDGALALSAVLVVAAAAILLSVKVLRPR